MSQNLRFTVTVEGREHLLEPELRDVFSRDLSQALLLGWHINYPAPVWEPADEDWFDSAPETLSNGEDPERQTYVIEKLKEWGITTADDLPLSPEQELRLLVLVLRARMDSGMTDPAGRAGKILRYAPNDVIEKIVEMMGFTRGNQDQESFIVTGLKYGLQDPRSDRDSTAVGTGGWNGGRRLEDPDQDPVLTDFWEERGSV